MIEISSLRLSALDHALDRLAQHLGNDRRVQFGRVDDLGDLVIEIAAQPRHCGELHPVGFLMQADPEPEVGRIDIELTLDGNDVRCDEQQSAARCVGIGAREERIELAKDLRRQIAEQRAHLDAGDPRPKVGHGGI